jgi:hypothetical protein
MAFILVICKVSVQAPYLGHYGHIQILCNSMSFNLQLGARELASGRQAIQDREKATTLEHAYGV